MRTAFEVGEEVAYHLPGYPVRVAHVIRIGTKWLYARPVGRRGEIKLTPAGQPTGGRRGWIEKKQGGA